jgi:hypothetical protein
MPIKTIFSVRSLWISLWICTGTVCGQPEIFFHPIFCPETANFAYKADTAFIQSASA